jgi:hypothetical protein
VGIIRALKKDAKLAKPREYTQDNQLEKAREIKDFYQKTYPQIENVKDAFFRVASAKLEIHSNQLEKAKENAIQAIQLTKDVQNNDIIYQALLCLAQVFLFQNDQVNAVAILKYLKKQPPLRHWLQRELNVTLSHFDSSIGLDTHSQEPSQLIWLN